MAKTIFGNWWDRLRGRLKPEPCPFSKASVLENPLRRLIAAPDHVLGRFGVHAGETVLEIGPGIGYYSLEAASRVTSAGRLICLDIQREMLAEVYRRMKAANLRADLVQASGADLPLRSDSHDHVLLIGVLGELLDRATALAEVRRVLRPGGRLSVSEQFPDPDFITRGTLRRELRDASFIEGETRGILWYTSVWAKERASN
jgi:ubiquinone/menaquinone biosynthesis C-methylase UbiE